MIIMIFLLSYLDNMAMGIHLDLVLEILKSYHTVHCYKEENQNEKTGDHSASFRLFDHHAGERRPKIRYTHHFEEAKAAKVQRNCLKERAS